MLIDRGADPLSTVRSGDSALHIAVDQMNDSRVIRALLYAKRDLAKMWNNDGKLPIDLVVDPEEIEDPETIRFLSEYIEQIRQVFYEADIWLNRRGPLFVRLNLQISGLIDSRIPNGVFQEFISFL